MLSIQTWATQVSAGSLYLSAITLLELEMGVLRLERRDAAQGAVMRTWLDGHVLPAFAGRVQAVDAAVVLQCARLHVPDKPSGRDAMIAATALVHGMTVVTRNAVDFEASGVRLLNPWLAQLQPAERCAAWESMRDPWPRAPGPRPFWSAHPRTKCLFWVSLSTGRRQHRCCPMNFHHNPWMARS